MDNREDLVRISFWLNPCLITLTLLNVWLSSSIYTEHPIKAALNAAMAGPLLLALLMSDARRGGE
jgi:hypothetical protein